MLFISTVAVTYQFAKGRFPIADAIFLVVGPWAALAAAFRPDWLILALVALPASATALVQTNRMVLLLVIALVVTMLTRPKFSFAFGTGITPLMLLVLAGSTYHADVGVAALDTNHSLMLLIVYYALLALLAFNLTRLGELKSQQFSGAFVVGVFTTLGLGLAGYDNAWFPGGSEIVFRTYLGYLAVGGLGVGLAWMFAREMRHRGMITAVTAGLLFLTVASFGRAVWIAGAATFTVLAWRSGRRAQVVIAALVVGSALLLPGAQQEISSTESGDIAEAFRTGEIATGRWDLWTGLWERGTTALPWGNGFGYTWSLDSEDVLGVEGVFTTGESTLVPPHNDFLLLFIEFGVVGVFLLGWFWVAVIRAFFTRTARSDWRSALDGQVLLGILLTGLVMTFVDNLFSIRPFAERFFPAAGIMLGLAYLERSRSIRGGRRLAPYAASSEVGSMHATEGRE